MSSSSKLITNNTTKEGHIAKDDMDNVDDSCSSSPDLSSQDSDIKMEDNDVQKRTAAKSKTLPTPKNTSSSTSKLMSLSQHFKKSNSLKRSITLMPKIKPFMRSNGNSENNQTSNDSKIAKKAKSSPHNGTRSKIQPHLTADDFNISVKRFFNRFVSHLSSSAKSRSKYELSEERLQEWKRRFEEGKVPGVVGIRNHGNTCFINAILQCLSYTDILAEYFVLDQYKSDLRRKHRIANLTKFNKRTGNKGEITEQLATLLKSLWSLQYDPEISIRFKSLIDKHASQYKGSCQHDAQEFLLWLLDQVHEDLNTATKRRYKNFNKSNSNNERTDEQLASEALANYMRCNNSFVMDVFQAQFRSSLTCPSCERQSNTFDPFLCISLPIPQKQTIPVYVTVLYIDQTPRQVKIGLTIGIHETIGDLRKTLAEDTGIGESEILLTEIGPLGFLKTLRDNQPVTIFKTEVKEPLYCIELPKHHKTSEEDGAFVVITWVNIFKEGPIEKRFGSPYAMQISRETLYADLQKLMMKEMSPILHNDILISAQKVPLFKIRVMDGLDESSTYLDPEVDLPMYAEVVEQALNLCSVEPNGCPNHVKFALEWDMPAKSQIINDDSDVIEEHSSVKEVAKCPEDGTNVTLQECFELYTSAEKLGQGDAWFCPACKRKQEVVKRMGLWSVPDVLVIHLKRFKQGASSANKLSTMVDFPLEGFDMSPNVTKPNGAVANGNIGSAENSNANNTIKILNSFSPWRHPKRFVNSRGEDQVYDLYAVCNHYGSDLQGGHYTAFCRNPTDGQWYNFDDMHTKSITDSEVITEHAYILFYQRQSAGSSSSASSSSSGSSNSEHWVFRMPDFTYKKKNGGVIKLAPTSPSKSKRKKANTDTNSEKSSGEDQSSIEDSELSSKSSESNFKRNTKKYSTMPVKRTTAVVDCEIEHHSDIELDPESPMDDISEEQNTITNDDDLEESDKNDDDDDNDEISRPIDQNDVD